MKNIVLIGDSIRMGYDKYVKDSLKEVANVFYPDENCRFAEYTLRFLHEWKAKGEWGDDIDLVHWNAGLWDVIELFDDEPLSTPEYYENAIKRIDKRIRMLFPKAKVVFATSTAVLDGKFGYEFKRHNAIIEKYNSIALKALENTGTVINDLYSLTKDCPEKYHSDAVHYYTDEGRECIGGRVLSVICKELSVNSLAASSSTSESYSKQNVGM